MKSFCVKGFTSTAEALSRPATVAQQPPSAPSINPVVNPVPQPSDPPPTPPPPQPPTPDPPPPPPDPPPTPEPPPPVIGGDPPFLSTWENNMVSFGEQLITKLGRDHNLGDVYYDGARVFYQITDYTRNTRWLEGVRLAEGIYRDGYLLPNNGGLPGFWVFPHGLYQDFIRTGDTTSRDALQKLVTRAAFANIPDWNMHIANDDGGGSRECAYNIMNHYLAKAAGVHDDAARRLVLINYAYGHYDQWFVDRTASYMRPFMAALTGEALIMHFNNTTDQAEKTKVKNYIKLACDEIWTRTWVEGEFGFRYTDRSTPSGGTDVHGPNGGSDVALLIAPLYSWYYRQSGDQTYAQRFDKAFESGVRFGSGSLVNGKQFNQAYRWAFDGLRWRRGQD